MSASPFVAAQASGAARPQALSVGGAPEAGEWSARQHDALVEAVRTGRTAPQAALETLARWHERQLPDVATLGRVASDGIVWGLQADDPARALAWARSVPSTLIRDYALDAGFRAARMAPDRALEGELLAQMQSRRPAAWQTRIDQVLWLMDQGDLNAADRALAALSPEAAAGNVELRAAWLDARAALAKAQGRKVEAMGAYSELAEVAPARTYATRESLFLLADQAAPAAAYSQARTAEAARPGTFRPIELARLEQAALAQQVQ
ncbi:MAG: hypothetical protein KJ901_18430, partial [Gammaproteobacteria bacterium]|nr:hypothetical protein [Gammaproteobacteria bacterium]